MNTYWVFLVEIIPIKIFLLINNDKNFNNVCCKFKEVTYLGPSLPTGLFVFYTVFTGYWHFGHNGRYCIKLSINNNLIRQ